MLYQEKKYVTKTDEKEHKVAFGWNDLDLG